MANVSAETIAVVKGTVPVLREHGVNIIGRFYDILFERYPEVKRQFNVDRQRGGKSKKNGVPSQVVSLANAVLAYAKNIDRVEALLPVVERIAHKHICRGVKGVQYDAVGECLIAGIQEVLQDAASDEFVRAWTEAYGVLAGIFIETEKRLQEELEGRAGYKGFVDMEVAKVEELEEHGGKRLLLKPVGVGMPQCGEGQFVGLKVKEGEDGECMTTMSICGAGEEGLWIRVEESEEMASVYLLQNVDVGSILSVSVPAGKALEKDDKKN